MTNNARAQSQVSPRGDTYRARVLLDIDGIVCDFITGGLRIVSELGITAGIDDVVHYQMEKLLPDDLHEEFGRRIRERGFCASLRPYPDARDFVFALTTRCARCSTSSASSALRIRNGSPATTSSRIRCRTPSVGSR